MDLSYMNSAQRVLAEDIIRKCARSRVYFVTVVLGVENVEDWQMEVLEALDKGETKISIRSGHGVGKTALCSWLALHFLLFRDDVKVIVTSPSFKQMNDGLIPEVQKWASKLPDWMSSSLETISDRVVRKPNVRNNFLSFRTARKENPEALAGVHASHVLIIVDEASGVDEVVYETGQGALSTKGAIAVLIGNPTKPSGFFYKTQTALADLWWTRKVSCMDSSRVSQEYIESQRRTYGADSREFAVRVLGEFPESGADAVIPRAFIESAVDRDVHVLENPLIWGIDPGRGGDPSGFIARTPNAILEAEEIRYDNLMLLVGWIKSKWDSLPSSKRPESIFVDSIGLGAGVYDRLNELGLPVIAVNVSEVAAMSERYMRLRAELWYKAREWFEASDKFIPSQLPNLRKLIEELCSVEQAILSTGKVNVESKEQMKRRGLASPNLADAFVLTFAHDGAIASGSWKGVGWKSVDTLKYRAPGFR
jgi:phage terminase large subunit